MRRIAALTAAAVAVSAAPALAKDLAVANATSPPDCAKNAQYPTIQAAVTAAAPGDHIKVCPGTYVEQVKIPAGKDNITLQGNGNPRDANQPTNQQTIIQAPAMMTSPKAIVEVSQSQNVKITQFTITGPGGGPCDSLEYGVRIDQGGSADIEQNHITKIEDNGTAGNGCQNGIGVQAGRDNTTAGDVTTGTVILKNNTIDQYQKGGVDLSNTGSFGDIENNLILGNGTTYPIIAPNGIEVTDGATAAHTASFDGKVANNVVAGNNYAGATQAMNPQAGTESVGILLINQGPTDVENNVLQVQQDNQPPSANNDIGIYDFAPTGTTTISNNKVVGQLYNGIVLDSDSGHTTASNNQVSGTTTHFSLIVSGTDVGFGSGDGFLVYDGNTGSLLQNNQSNNNVEDGFHLDSTTSNNTLKDNQARGNKTYDCEDDSTGGGTAGTANTWTNDHGVTENHPGLCKQ